ncbi:MAG: Rne/Rng family ribonuclease [Alphaproteobacteria bacterium]|nr:Rne/Rng family ribonuclease [Alphaproteobacteria bacterium]
MTKRMLIDDTQPEETRVVVINGNKLEDVEFESSSRKQIKGNIYLAKVMRIEPSLQAAFVDYGGNKHGFLAFGEIHPDYYNISDEEMAAVDKEVDEIIEAKKQALKERELERERQREERAAYQAKLEEERRKAQAEAEAAQKDAEESIAETPAAETAEDTQNVEVSPAEETAAESVTEEGKQKETETVSEETPKKNQKKRIAKKRFKKQKSAETEKENAEELKVMAESTGTEDDVISEEVTAVSEQEEISEETAAELSENDKSSTYNKLAEEDLSDDDEDDEETENDFELQRKLLKVRKLFHRSNIQDVIKEGQILLIQVVKEERGNKGAALTTYLSLAGRYCVLMPNRIKSGGVSRKITNASDRKRLKAIVKELPLTSDMSMIVRTAGEEKTKADIVRDYNYLMRSWNQIRLSSLKAQAPALIHEEGNLIKRALRDMYTKDISEIIVDGEEAYKTARDFVKILSPHSLKKIKSSKKGDMPLFQRFQVEGQLDKLHDTNVQLESGGYLVINPTEALVSIDVNSGRATKEKDLEETALKTNLEAADEIARQLRMRNLAGLVVVDFIDMDEQKNNLAVEKRMKEAMKKDRARIQIAKMSIFGLLEISRQRMHSSFMESNYQVCPHCQGKGMVRTIESGAVLVLRSIEEEGIKNRSSKINVFVPSDIAIYLLNQKRQTLCDLEQKYKMDIIISADDSLKNVSEFRIERTKTVKAQNENKPADEKEAVKEKREKRQPAPAKSTENKKETRPVQEETPETADVQENAESAQDTAENGKNNRRRRDRRNRFDRNNRRNRRNRYNNNEEVSENGGNTSEGKEKQEAVILYNSHEDITSKENSSENTEEAPKKRKSTWWKKLING